MKRPVMQSWDPRAAPRALMLAGATGGALMGLPYVVHAFGPAEAEVADWGWVSFALGVLLLVARAAMRGRGTALPPALVAPVVALLVAAYGALALLQTLPALLWVLFHGQPISDGSPPGGFVAHWAFALPHAVVAAVALGVVYRLLRAIRTQAPHSFAEALERWRPPDPPPPR